MSNWNIINSWNGSLFNSTISVWQQLQSWNGSIYNSSHWSTINTWNGSLYNESVNTWKALSTWNGTGTGFNELLTLSAPAENCNLLKKHKSRLFASGSTEYPYRLYYSSLSNGGNWSTTGGTIDLPSFERIMALEIL